ncbi:trimeric intracellular cation channel family protein [Psychrobacter pygoscelis]|uniref:trimeric intracellular cation channel family protein n=1 Tax=Psychrobacter pygoscelis TaxID=2488563 RepID=UPI00103BEAC1|nr:trimeric intracellular cation channel family protein [Psychrobacter pygoscelis]
MFNTVLDSSVITTFNPGSLLFLFDMIGIVACSVSGTILAKHKNFDVFGCLLVSMVTAIGGGTVRDVILDRHPLFWMVDMSYLIVITISSLIMQIFFHPSSRRVDKFLKLSDTIGLSAFTLIGIKVANSMGANIPVALLLGVITIIVGGIIRDMICNEIPLVLQQEIYITAALAGGILFFIMRSLGITEWVTEITTMLTIFTIRMLAIRYDWQFPQIELTKH